jgi:hypothetical protein
VRTKTFGIVTSLSIVVTIAAAILSLIGITITGFYPAIIVLAIIALIPVISKYYAGKLGNRSDNFHRKYYNTFIIINLLLILIVIWLAFVILVDRVFSIIL